MTISNPFSSDEKHEAGKSDEAWRRDLTPEQYAVLRKDATEPPGSSPLNDEKRAGMFACAGCGNPVFPSETKYESGTGWPSFYAPLPSEEAGTDGVETKTDFKLVVPRTEVHCARCGGHLGHVFNDGPAPTGKRYCLNGAALDFTPRD